MSVVARQVAWEQRIFWRNRPAAFFTFALPLVLVVTVGLLSRGATVRGERYANWFIPGMLGLTIVVTAFGGLAITLTIRREHGILKRMRGTPLHPALYLGSLVASLLVVMLAETAIVLGVGVLLLSVHLPARLDELAAVIVLGAACFAALGMALAPHVPTAEGSSAVVNAVYLPLLLVSGVFFPVAALPSFVQALARALPLAPVVTALHVLLRDGRLGSSEAAGLLVTLIWGVAGAVLAARTFRWEPGAP
jgi:ABC-2 type transport system permease protein